MFGLSRLLLPGSLIEEAALRREAFMRFDANDIDSFSKLGAQYLRRFSKSAYSDQFRQRLDLSIRHLARTADPSVIGKLEPLFEDATNAYTESLLLLFAREGLMHGRMASGRAATDRAKSFTHSDPKLADRMKLYTAFVQVMTSESAQARDQLALLRGKVDGPEDRWLIEAGTSLANRITRWPPDVPPDMSQQEQLKPDDVASIAQVSLTKSAQLLVRADK
jgi:chemotaxis protein MotC